MTLDTVTSGRTTAASTRVSSGPAHAPEKGASLHANELNLFDETAVAVSSTAPAYSLAATVGLLFVAVAYAGPAIIIVSFIPMLFIAGSYFYLNRKDPNCGAAYEWISRFVGPHIGWFNGWVQLAASILFCVAAPLLAGTYTLQFFHSVGWINASTASEMSLAASIGALWLVGITIVTVYGVRSTANAQWIFVIIQSAILLGASILGIVKVAVQHPVGSTGFHWSWLSPLSIHGYQGLAAGAVLGLFFFWGWDTAVNLNEESKQTRKIPGQACVISMFLLLFVFVLNIVAVQMLVPSKELVGQGPNLLFYFSEQVGGQWMGYLMIFAVLSSTSRTSRRPCCRRHGSRSPCRETRSSYQCSEGCTAGSRRRCSVRRSWPRCASSGSSCGPFRQPSTTGTETSSTTSVSWWPSTTARPVWPAPGRFARSCSPMAASS